MSNSRLHFENFGDIKLKDLGRFSNQYVFNRKGPARLGRWYRAKYAARINPLFHIAGAMSVVGFVLHTSLHEKQSKNGPHDD